MEEVSIGKPMWWDEAHVEHMPKLWVPLGGRLAFLLTARASKRNGAPNERELRLIKSQSNVELNGPDGVGE